eukprot:2426435-Prymnesium_polylepis.1
MTSSFLKVVTLRADNSRLISSVDDHYIVQQKSVIVLQSFWRGRDARIEFDIDCLYCDSCGRTTYHPDGCCRTRGD